MGWELTRAINNQGLPTRKGWGNTRLIAPKVLRFLDPMDLKTEMNKVTSNPGYYTQKVREHLLYHLIIEQISGSGLDSVDLATKDFSELTGLVAQAARELQGRTVIEDNSYQPFASDEPRG